MNLLEVFLLWFGLGVLVGLAVLAVARAGES